MANPYVLNGGVLNVERAVRASVVLKDLKPPKPPIRQLPLPTVLFPFLKKGG